MAIDLQPFVQMLVCPACRSKLVIDDRSFVCSSSDCRRRYLVKDDIPVMLVDESQTVTPEEWTTLMAAATSGTGRSRNS
jgi:uncharacterized protein YbaR (Trm112 family)